MTIEIKPETERLVEQEIGSGHFRSVDELIVEGVHAWLEKQGLVAGGRGPQTDRLRQEFNELAERWRRDTLHLSLVSKKVAHPAYFRIMGMGESVIPLLLEELRDKPAHWFAALRATANTDPSARAPNPAAAREAWLEWGRSKGLID